MTDKLSRRYFASLLGLSAVAAAMGVHATKAVAEQVVDRARPFVSRGLKYVPFYLIKVAGDVWQIGGAPPWLEHAQCLVEERDATGRVVRIVPFQPDPLPCKL